MWSAWCKFLDDRVIEMGFFRVLVLIVNGGGYEVI